MTASKDEDATKFVSCQLGNCDTNYQFAYRIRISHEKGFANSPSPHNSIRTDSYSTKSQEKSSLPVVAAFSLPHDTVPSNALFRLLILEIALRHRYTGQLISDGWPVPPSASAWILPKGIHNVSSQLRYKPSSFKTVLNFRVEYMVLVTVSPNVDRYRCSCNFQVRDLSILGG